MTDPLTVPRHLRTTNGTREQLEEWRQAVIIRAVEAGLPEGEGLCHWFERMVAERDALAALLVRYVLHVLDCESIDYLEMYGYDYHEFTEQDRESIRKLMVEAGHDGWA